MAVYPQQYFTLNDIPMRTGPHGERAVYDSKSLNRKSAGVPKGVHLGFEPLAVGSVLQLHPDSTHALSALKVPSADDPGGMDIVTDQIISMDFVASLASEFLPDGVQVVAVARYLEDAATTAEIITRSKTLTSLVATIDPTPAAFDLTNVPRERITPSSVSISVNVDGFGPDTITDDGNGNIASTGPALPLGGTVDYYTGEFVGVTVPLTALSTVTYSRTRGIARDEVALCRVTGTPGAITVVGSGPAWGAPDDRDLPLAAGAADLDYGFMPPDSMESLAAAVEILNEVTAARIDLQSATHPDLKTRLDTDLGTDAMGVRLGKVTKLVRSNARSTAAGESQVNISGSMSAINRDYEPKRTFAGDGSETTAGAVAAPVDTVRNVAVVLDASTGERLLDNETGRNIVIGRVEQVTDEVLTGELAFLNALTAVTGDAATTFTAQLEIGDTIQGPDGNFYEVATISADDGLLLKDAYQGSTASSANLLRRRFLLKFSKLTAGLEQAHTLEAAATIEAFFPVFMSLAQANFHNALTMHRSGERPPVPDATTSIPGKVELAGAISPFAGAVKLQQRGVNVGDPGDLFHTLNFSDAASQLTQLADGIVEVAGIGPKGIDGIGGGLGPEGPPGPDGPSYDAIATFNLDTEEFLGPGPAAVDVVHTVNFGFNIGFLSGGIANQRATFLHESLDWFEITDIRIDSGDPQIGIIEGNGAAGGSIDAYVTLYLDAAGYTT